MPGLPDDLGVEDHPQLSGSGLEYRILLIYSRDAGLHSAKLSFNVDQGTQDTGETKLRPFQCCSIPEDQAACARRQWPALRWHLSFFEMALIAFIPIRQSAWRLTFTSSRKSIVLTENSSRCRRAPLPPHLRVAPNTLRNAELYVDTKGPNELTFHLKRWISPATTAGILAIITSTPMVARTMQTRPWGCARRYGLGRCAANISMWPAFLTGDPTTTINDNFSAADRITSSQDPTRCFIMILRSPAFHRVMRDTRSC